MKIASATAYLAQTRAAHKEPSNQPGEPELFACGLIRDIRVHAQDLQRCVADIQTALSAKDSETQTKRLTEALAGNRASFERNRKNINDLLSQLKTFFTEHYDLYNFFGDEVTHVADCWNRTIENWPTDGDKAGSVAIKLADIEKWLREIIWHCGFVTIPGRVNEHLSGLRPGQALNFPTRRIAIKF